jgi:hypothetical protein
MLESQYSNFRLLGIGKETEGQKRRREKIKKAIDDARKNIRETTKDATKSIGSAVKDAGKNIKQTTQEVLKNDNLKKFAKARFLTYNPIVAIPRSSALLAFRVNLFGISTRLYPAFLDEATLVKYNFDVANAQNVKRAWERVANFWEDKIGGDRNKLREAISGAWNKPVFKTKRAKERLKPYDCTIIRKTSFDAAKDFSDESLDFVYIDGAHDFKNVTDDINIWSKKVRKGGVISGHDYIAVDRKRDVIEVKQAVDAYVSANKINPWYALGREEEVIGEIRDKQRSWMWIKV